MIDSFNKQPKAGAQLQYESDSVIERRNAYAPAPAASAGPRATIFPGPCVIACDKACSARLMTSVTTPTGSYSVRTTAWPSPKANCALDPWPESSFDGSRA